jgi:hypothetical protein
MTSAGIEPATFRFVAQHLNHCATAVPYYCYYYAVFLRGGYKVNAEFICLKCVGYKQNGCHVA